MADPVLALVVLRARDIDKTVAFYEAVTLAFVREQHGSGPVHYACTLGASVIEIYPAAGESEPNRRAPGATMLGLRVDAVESAVERVCMLGATVITKPTSGASHRWVVEDPDGRAVELTPLV